VRACSGAPQKKTGMRSVSIEGRLRQKEPEAEFISTLAKNLEIIQKISTDLA
jgi:hypothetical protein